MAHELIVQCERAPHDVYIGRPSKSGSPVVIGLRVGAVKKGGKQQHRF